MKASEWIDRLKQAKGWESDYRVSKELALSRQTVSKYRSGTSTTMDDEAAVKVAHALGEAPEIVLLDQVAERTKNDEARTALSGLLKRLGGVAASILLTVGMGSFQGGNAHAAGSQTAKNNLYIVESGRRRKKAPKKPRATWFSGLALA